MVRARPALRWSFVLLTASLALMPATRAGDVWLGLRFVAGVASALIFVIAASALLTGLRTHAHHLVGWGFGGVGAGIALSGGLVLGPHASGTWQQAWWSAAGLTVVCAVLAWRLPMPAHRDEPPASPGDSRAGPRWFAALLTSYSLEGIGYIIAGTFLVAAIDQGASGWIGTGAWVLVGLAAVPSPALWAWLSRTWSRPTLLVVALVVQAVGIALPVLGGGAVAALASAILFGATFLGIATIVLAVGAHLRVTRAVAIFTSGYSAGQIIGPVAVTPLLHNGYHVALLVSAGVVALAAVAAGAPRLRFPHHLGPLPGQVRATRVPGRHS